MVAIVRWARKGGPGAAMLGSALILLLGVGLVPEQIPQQRIEEAREEKAKKARNPVTLREDWTELTSAAAFLLGEVSTVWRLAKYIVSNRAHSIAV
jgi:hypothetical protein